MPTWFCESASITVSASTLNLSEIFEVMNRLNCPSENEFEVPFMSSTWYDASANPRNCIVCDPDASARSIAGIVW